MNARKEGRKSEINRKRQGDLREDGEGKEAKERGKEEREKGRK